MYISASSLPTATLPTPASWLPVGVSLTVTMHLPLAASADSTAVRMPCVMLTSGGAVREVDGQRKPLRVSKLLLPLTQAVYTGYAFGQPPFSPTPVGELSTPQRRRRLLRTPSSPSSCYVRRRAPRPLPLRTLRCVFGAREGVSSLQQSYGTPAAPLPVGQRRCGDCSGHFGKNKVLARSGEQFHS